MWSNYIVIRNRALQLLCLCTRMLGRVVPIDSYFSILISEIQFENYLSLAY